VKNAIRVYCDFETEFKQFYMFLGSDANGIAEIKSRDDIWNMCAKAGLEPVAI